MTPRFHIPLIEPDVRFSRIRLSDRIMLSPTEGYGFFSAHLAPFHGAHERSVIRRMQDGKLAA
ncbi:hypothetical protein FACS1894158_09490 [Betaproteobacteria bacterium]|nr:hypothetical protein FACS1894158_09490 [Betaproteobacteria bacterium]